MHQPVPGCFLLGREAMGQVRGVLGLWRDLKYWALVHEDALAMAGAFVAVFGVVGWGIYWFFWGA